MKFFLLTVLLCFPACTMQTVKESYPFEEQVSVKKSLNTPVNHEVCFSPEESCDKKLIKFIESARESIDIAIFSFTLKSIADAIVKRKEKISGKIRIIVDKRQAGTKDFLVVLKTLENAKIEVRRGLKSGGYMHNKFIIVDGRMIETGSFNFTEHATQENAENQIYIDDPAVIGHYQKQFDKIWKSLEAPPK